MAALTGSAGTSPVNSLQTRSTAASIGRLQGPVLGAFPVSRTSYRHLSSVTLRRVPDLVDCPVEGVDQGRRERSPFFAVPCFHSVSLEKPAACFAAGPEAP